MTWINQGRKNHAPHVTKINLVMFYTLNWVLHQGSKRVNQGASESNRAPDFMAISARILSFPYTPQFPIHGRPNFYTIHSHDSRQPAQHIAIALRPNPFLPHPWKPIPLESSPHTDDICVRLETSNSPDGNRIPIYYTLPAGKKSAPT
jgi:hypothetical protein